MTLPDADPYLFPLVAVLACFGLVVLYRLDEDFARDQAQWFVVGLIVFTATIVALRHDHRVLERYRYVIALGGILLLLLPRLGNPVNGAYLSFSMGPISFQPAELAKIAIVIFLASYLRDTRQVLVVGARRFAGITFPPLKHLGPLLAVWGTAMVLLFVIQDLGSSLMFFGGFLALVYVATNRISFVLIGLALFALGARVLYAIRPTIESRVDAWLHPFDPELYNQEIGGSYQIAQSIFTQADGGFFGQGFGQALIRLGDEPPLLPAAHTDFIYAVITDELGLLGAVAVLLVYLLIIERGFKTAMLATDSFSKLLATGPDGGARAAGLRHRRRRHEAHPADRRDAAVHLLRRLLDRGELHPARAAAARLRPRAKRGRGVNAPILKLFVLVLVLFGALAAMTSYNSVIKAEDYRDNALNKRPQIEQALVKRGVIRARDGSLLARSIKGDDDIYRRRYSPGALRFSHALGYDYALTIGRAGLERSRNDALAGENDEMTSIVDDLSGKRKVGDNVITNLDPAAQQIALDALGGRRGSVVAIEPATGKVRVMASTPGYDPNSLRDAQVFSRLNRENNSPLFNRATQAGYVPGSTMKVVTAAAALDSGKFTPESTGRRQVTDHRLGCTAEELLRRAVRRDHLDHSTHQLRQHRLGAGRREARRRHVRRLHGALRVRLGPAAGLPRGPDDAERRVRRQGAEADRGRLRPRRHRPRRDRPGAPARDAAADGDGRRHGRQRRHADAAAHHEPDRRPRRAHGGAHRARGGRARDVRGVRRAADADDGQRRARGHRHRRRAVGASRSPARPAPPS